MWRVSFVVVVVVVLNRDDGMQRSRSTFSVFSQYGCGTRTTSEPNDHQVLFWQGASVHTIFRLGCVIFFHFNRRVKRRTIPSTQNALVGSISLDDFDGQSAEVARQIVVGLFAVRIEFSRFWFFALYPFPSSFSIGLVSSILPEGHVRTVQ